LFSHHLLCRIQTGDLRLGDPKHSC
jgi:hypothetical protein